MRSHIHRSVSLGIGLGLAALVVSAASAQDLTRYRDYALGSSVSEVVIASGTRATDVRSVHERPASIQELEVRPSYGRSDSRLPDPVRQVEFRFLDDALYQVVVSYDRGRTTGLTDRDVVDAVAAEYGKPTGVNATVGLPADLQRDSVVLARWTDVGSTMTLVRSVYAPEFRLILLATDATAAAEAAISEALRLDAREAPRREAERRTQDALDASTTRLNNKAAFRP